MARLQNLESAYENSVSGLGTVDTYQMHQKIQFDESLGASPGHKI